ncbi:MAG: ABC transporter ATP-binding protein [Chloroflexi bacterium]|nr:ABC transporter ATP-binding protein [Chloroflexota bacterium]MCL5273889.1 ABC transporter ATP-binding protein [Chloroflexota bacterium]
MSEGPFILCDNLVKIHKIADLEVVALQGLDLEVKQGELLGIVGASGSGKSTLLNILGGLDRPSAGRVVVAGRDLLKMSNTALTTYRRTQVGFVWQQGARNVIPYLSSASNVELPMILAGHAGGAAKKRAFELLDAVGLADRRNHYLGMLSGGEQQRVAIAVALANAPSLLLADEPTGELDSNTALSIYQVFRDLCRKYGVTTLIVSHDPKIARHVDRVVAIRDGKLAGETVRRAPPRTGASMDQPIHEDHFEEYAVLDSAGRLQIPKELREQYGIKERARLEPAEAGILVKAVERQNVEQVAVNGDQAESVLAKIERRGVLGWLARRRSKSKG